MEEPLWSVWFPHVHAAAGTHQLDASTCHPRFESFYDDHLRKILKIRQGSRYVAKNNYHVTRMEYLSRLYPDAEFIVPIRDPVTHVNSLVRQHELFCEYAQHDSRVAKHLAAAGHYEFGPQRVPIRLHGAEADRVDACWQNGEEHRGYSIQWKEVYRLIHQLLQRRDDLSRRIHVVRYEDFCASPQRRLNELLDLVGLKHAASREGPSCRHIEQSQCAIDLTSVQRHEILEEVREVAGEFGYSCD